MKTAVLLYVPNIIGYVRLLLLFIGFFFYDRAYILLPLYSIAAILDTTHGKSLGTCNYVKDYLHRLCKGLYKCIDGCLARRLNQTSAFGAWLDVLVDNIGRSLLWCRLYSWGIFIVCVEWTTFVCTHTMGSRWKQNFGAAPWWVKTVMDNGFRTPIGVFTVAGLHVLPLYLYFYEHQPDWNFLGHIWFLLIVPIIVLAMGRLLCLMTELWCIQAHIRELIGLEEDKKLESLTSDLRASDSAT